MKRSALPEYVTRFRDRHGKWRFRARRRGWRGHYFKAIPGTAEFASEYQEWLAGKTIGPRIAERRIIERSVSALAARIYCRSAWIGLAASTKVTYRGIIERFRAEHGHRVWSELTSDRIRKLVEAKASTPAAANNFLRMLNMMAKVAIQEGWTKLDPTAGIDTISIKSDGFHAWTEEEIAAFESRWPIGTRARLALALLIYSAQRRSDIVRLGRQHVRDKRLEFKQQKTGTEMSIPVLPELQAVIDASVPLDRLTFLTTAQGAPFTAAGFGNWFRECCDAAGLKKCSAHGLRKAAARRFAMWGCSTLEIMAWTGHTTLREIERYTKSVERIKLADSAMRRMQSERKRG